MSMDLDFDITPMGCYLNWPTYLVCSVSSPSSSLPQRVFGRSDLDFVGFLEFYVLTQLCCFDSVLGLPALSSCILPYSIESQMDWSWDLTSPVGGSTLGAASLSHTVHIYIPQGTTQNKEKDYIGCFEPLSLSHATGQTVSGFSVEVPNDMVMCVLICICAMACFLHTINFYMFQVVINF